MYGYGSGSGSGSTSMIPLSGRHANEVECEGSGEDWSVHTVTSLGGSSRQSTYETRRVIISRCLSVTIRLQHWVSLDNLVLQGANLRG